MLSGRACQGRRRLNSAGPDAVSLAVCSSPAIQGKAGSGPAAITQLCFGRKLATLPAAGFYQTRPGAASPLRGKSQIPNLEPAQAGDRCL